jgi:hypothetical protein
VIQLAPDVLEEEGLRRRERAEGGGRVSERAAPPRRADPVEALEMSDT